jgi:hypothetical protein
MDIASSVDDFQKGDAYSVQLFSKQLPMRRGHTHGAWKRLIWRFFAALVVLLVLLFALF